jgi:hypothetical protein
MVSGHRNLVFALTLAASAFLGASPANIDSQDGKPNATVYETVVYRQARGPKIEPDQAYSKHLHAEQVEASYKRKNEYIPSNFPRAVQTVRFVNPYVPVDISTVSTAAVPHSVPKTGALVGRAAQPDAAVERNRPTILQQKRVGSVMAQVDDYLWEVYQRVPTKKDGTGDFTWKDPAAAKHMGLGLKEYVIGGMDPEFREQLYHAGRAMDAAGLRWSMLSAFRDDYRQSLASGYKAGVSNSLHGGSHRTGGYGHGRAIDITGPDGTEIDVWEWIDDHGAKYGLRRPLPERDPAHVQQRGRWHQIALALRESRTRVGAGDKVDAMGRKTKTQKSAVASTH